jgi:curved DNA-binding protein CbpA
MKNYYEVLGLENFVSIEEVKDAYRKLSKKFHPDVNGGEKIFEIKLKELEDVYNILGNKEEKGIYDKKLQSTLNENQKSKETHSIMELIWEEYKSFLYEISVKNYDVKNGEYSIKEYPIENTIKFYVIDDLDKFLLNTLKYTLTLESNCPSSLKTLNYFNENNEVSNNFKSFSRFEDFYSIVNVGDYLADKYQNIDEFLSNIDNFKFIVVQGYCRAKTSFYMNDNYWIKIITPNKKLSNSFTYNSVDVSKISFEKFYGYDNLCVEIKNSTYYENYKTKNILEFFTFIRDLDKLGEVNLKIKEMQEEFDKKIKELENSNQNKNDKIIQLQSDIETLKKELESLKKENELMNKIINKT